MAYVLFIRDHKVVFKQSLDHLPFEITAPGTGERLSLGAGAAAEMAGLSIRVIEGDLKEAAGRQTPDGPPTLEGFSIKGKLGEGGMGSVWLATQHGTNRQVAIKTLHTGNLSQEQVARFALEIEVTAQLDHPNIGRLYESHVDEDLCYYAMEYIEGSELEDYVEAQKVSNDKWLEIMVGVCRAVQFAHQKGIIHRDLKPGNVMVTTAGKPKVVDFGIAKLVESDKANRPDSKLTTDGTHLGTPAYMSPEQIQANPALIDTRTDVYALGVIMYEQIVGKHPFGLEGSTMQLFMRVLKEEPKAPRAIKKSIHPDLEAVILKAIARNPEERYAAAGELADDIQRYLSREPVLAKPQTAFYVMRKKLAKHKGKLFLAVLTVLACVAYVAVSYVLILQERDKAKEAERIAATERDKAEARFDLGRDFARGLIFNLDDKLDEGVTAARAELIDHSRSYLEKLRAEAGERPDLLADIAAAYIKVGEVERQRGELASAIKAFEQSQKIYEEIAEMDDVEDRDAILRGRVDALLHLADAAEAAGDTKASKKHYDTATSRLKKHLKKNKKDDEARDLLIASYEGYGRLLAHMGDQGAGVKKLEEAVKLRKKRLAANPDDDEAAKRLASSYYFLGGLRLDQGEPAAALESYKKSLDLREKALERAPKNATAKRRVAAGYRGMGYAYRAQGELARAEASFEKSFEIYLDQVKADPINQKYKINLLWAYIYLAEVQMARENLGVARKNLEDGVAIAVKVAANAKDNTTAQRLVAHTFNMLGEVAFRQRKFAEAAEHFTQARLTTAPMVESNPKDLYAIDPQAVAIMGMARVAHARGLHEEAWDQCEEAIGLMRRLVEGSPKDLSYLKKLGLGLREVGSIAEARRLHFLAVKNYKEAEGIFEKLLAKDATNAEAKTALIGTLTARGLVQRKLSAKANKRSKKLDAEACEAFKSAQQHLDHLARTGKVPTSLAKDQVRLEKASKKCD